MSRVINPVRDASGGVLYHACPLHEMNIAVKVCLECPQLERIEKLPAKYRIHCNFPYEGVPLIEFVPPKAHDSVGKLKGFDVVDSERHNWVEPKLDGVRAIVHCTPQGVFITSRRRNAQGQYNQFQDNVPHLRDKPLLVALGQRGYTIFDSEIMAPTKVDTLAVTMGITGSKPERAIELQAENGKAQLHIFDMPYFIGNSIESESLEYRRARLERFRAHFRLDEHLNLVPYRYAHSERKRELFEEALERGQEGIVIKDPQSTYHASKAWLKVKQKLTVDALVTGWERGAKGGKYEHTLGALKVSVVNAETGELQEIARVSPGDDFTRGELFAEITTLLDRHIIVELEAQMWTKEYRLRHPRILRYRTDLSDPNTVDFKTIKTG